METALSSYRWVGVGVQAGGTRGQPYCQDKMNDDNTLQRLCLALLAVEKSLRQRAMITISITVLWCVFLCCSYSPQTATMSFLCVLKRTKTDPCFGVGLHRIPRLTQLIMLFKLEFHQENRTHRAASGRDTSSLQH